MSLKTIIATPENKQRNNIGHKSIAHMIFSRDTVVQTNQRKSDGAQP